MSNNINKRYIDLSLAYMSVLEEEEIVLTEFRNDAYIFSCPFCAHNYQHQANPKKSGHLIRIGGDTWKFICTKEAAGSATAGMEEKGPPAFLRCSTQPSLSGIGRILHKNPTHG